MFTNDALVKAMKDLEECEKNARETNSDKSQEELRQAKETVQDLETELKLSNSTHETLYKDFFKN